MKRPITLLLAIGLGTSVVAAASGPPPIVLPDFGSSADVLLTAGEQRRLGNTFMRSVRAALPVIDDPLLTDYIEGLGSRLVAASGQTDRSFELFLIDRPLINAFAGPDGHIGVFTGLILATENESELAAVVAHEIAHVTQQHLLRAFEDQKRLSGPTLALLIAAAILGSQAGSNAGAAALAGVQAAAIQRQINFTRENEKEADRIGITTLAQAGFDPFAMPGFFERLSKASRLYESGAPEYLRTHPMSTSRTADALGRAEAYGHKQRPDDLRFHLVRANLRQRGHTNPDRAVEHFRSTLSSGRYRNEPSERYGLALALARRGELGEARSLAAGLVAAHPNVTELIVLDAELDRRTGKAGEGIAKLRTAVGLRPENLPLRIAYAEALLAADKPGPSLETLEDVARRVTPRAQVFRLLSDAAGKSGRRATSHRYRAEQLYAMGDLEPAIRQLEIALRQRDADFHEASRIEVRLEALREEEKELKKAEGFLKGSR